MVIDAIAASEIRALCTAVHRANKKWWVDLETGEPKQRNVGEMLMLIVSEISEAMEGDRKGLQCDKLPHRQMIEAELADAVIRIFDLAAGLNLDLGGAFVEKMEFNATREDHTREARVSGEREEVLMICKHCDQAIFRVPPLGYFHVSNSAMECRGWTLAEPRIAGREPSPLELNQAIAADAPWSRRTSTP